jgi:hypothetical protein
MDLGEIWCWLSTLKFVQFISFSFLLVLDKLSLYEVQTEFHKNCFVFGFHRGVCEEYYFLGLNAV